MQKRGPNNIRVRKKVQRGSTGASRTLAVKTERDILYGKLMVYRSLEKIYKSVQNFHPYYIIVYEQVIKGILKDYKLERIDIRMLFAHHLAGAISPGEDNIYTLKGIKYALNDSSNNDVRIGKLKELGFVEVVYKDGDVGRKTENLALTVKGRNMIDEVSIRFFELVETRFGNTKLLANKII